MSDTGPGSYLAPRLAHALVADAMRHGVLTCAADTEVRAAARTMALHHVHSIVVTDSGDPTRWRVLSDADLLASLLDSPAGDRAAGDVARRTFPTVSEKERLSDAAARMRDEGISHLLVLGAQDGRPAGMLSTLDIAGVLAWGEG